MYITALYFTMTCMTSIGFGNVAADTDNEKVIIESVMLVPGVASPDLTIEKQPGSVSDLILTKFTLKLFLMI